MQWNFANIMCLNIYIAPHAFSFFVFLCLLFRSKSIILIIIWLQWKQTIFSFHPVKTEKNAAIFHSKRIAVQLRPLNNHF